MPVPLDQRLQDSARVRRDKNEEPILVSYIVPELKEWPQWLKSRGLEEVEDEGTDMGTTIVYNKRFRWMQAEVRDHLKGRLPNYAVPTVYIVLNKLPLNPNGKIDKQNLPFPDIAEQTEEASEDDLKRWASMTETERTVATKWAGLISGLNAKIITPQNDFFHLGGHSILAQQMLLDMRKTTGANVSINTIYEHPTLAGFSAQIDRQLGRVIEADGEGAEEQDPEYAISLDKLLNDMPTKYQTADPATIRASPNSTVFLTGATGFLGAYIIKDVLQRTSRAVRLIAHVRNTKDPKAALDRLRRSLEGYGLWNPDWSSRLSCVVGDLSKPQLEIENNAWQKLSQEVDMVIHNGATVHWVRRYQDMMTSNVNSTVDAMRLCNEEKPKVFAFVSSTSVLDIDHYVKLSDQEISTDQSALSEKDDMHRNRTGLETGYDQTKWVSEQLIREAGKRGLQGFVIRPEYILDDSETGVCNIDDFLIRILKGCIQLSSRSHIINTVNSVSVNHFARVVVTAALNSLPGGVHVVHVTGHPRLCMHEYLSLLEFYGYRVPEVSYDAWKEELEKYVSAGDPEKDQEQHALMPLYHFCVNDLPATTRAPELDDKNAVKFLKADVENWTGIDESAGYGIGREDVGRFLRYLAEIEFVTWPSGRGRALPEVNLSPAQLQAVDAVGGRGGVSK